MLFRSFLLKKKNDFHQSLFSKKTKMYCSSLCLLLPIFALEVPFPIIWRILLLNLSSLLCENYTNQMTIILDHVNIIHLSTYIAFGAYHISLCFIGLYLLEAMTWETHHFKSMSYLVSCIRCMTNTSVYYWVCMGIVFQKVRTKQFSLSQWWCWHAFQSIYIYQILCIFYPHRTHLDSIADYACTKLL